MLHQNAREVDQKALLAIVTICRTLVVRIWALIVTVFQGDATPGLSFTRPPQTPSA